jgi:hypothetical protein
MGRVSFFFSFSRFWEEENEVEKKERATEEKRKNIRGICFGFRTVLFLSFLPSFLSGGGQKRGKGRQGGR